MRKKIFVLMLLLFTPGCLTEKAMSSTVPSSPPQPDKFIIIEKAKGMTRIRLKKINRPFLLPAEVKQIEQELNELNTDKTTPLTSIINASLKSREDEVKDGKIRDQILKNSPEKNEEFFVVPKVVEKYD